MRCCRLFRTLNPLTIPSSTRYYAVEEILLCIAPGLPARGGADRETYFEHDRRLLLAWLVAGCAYEVVRYILALQACRENVFSLWLGVPLTVAGWPWMVRADLMHGFAGWHSLAAVLCFVGVLIVGGLQVWRNYRTV